MTNLLEIITSCPVFPTDRSTVYDFCDCRKAAKERLTTFNDSHLRVLHRGDDPARPLAAPAEHECHAASREDFVRAANSLQLDEIVAIYIAKILGTDYHLAFMENGHPLVPLSTLQAGYRLMMHGLDVEGLHGWLRVIKRRQAAGLPIDPRVPTADRPVAPM
jgi:hypothetical protein